MAFPYSYSRVHGKKPEIIFMGSQDFNEYIHECKEHIQGEVIKLCRRLPQQHKTEFRWILAKCIYLFVGTFWLWFIAIVNHADLKYNLFRQQENMNNNFTIQVTYYWLLDWCHRLEWLVLTSLVFGSCFLFTTPPSHTPKNPIVSLCITPMKGDQHCQKTASAKICKKIESVPQVEF